MNRFIRKVFTEYLYLLLKNVLSLFVVSSWGSKFSLFNLFVIKLMSNSGNIFISNKGIKFRSIYRVCSIRGKRAWSKEPETIKWIEDNFCDRDVFYDIGANIGVYSLIANHLKNGVQVFAFEPESKSYAELNSNIFLNEASDKIQAYNIAVSNSDGVGVLNLSSGQPGMSDHQYVVDDLMANMYRQGCLSLTIDSIVNNYKLPTPNHIKIDVDGLEFGILSGAKSVLQSAQLKSIAIESNEEDLVHIEMLLEEYGFVMIEDDRLFNKEYNVRNYFFVKK